MNPLKKKDRLEESLFAFVKNAGRQYLRQQNIALNVAIKSPVKYGLGKAINSALAGFVLICV